jgi:O-antigen/teichoic acid export membrane protein
MARPLPSNPSEPSGNTPSNLGGDDRPPSFVRRVSHAIGRLRERSGELWWYTAWFFLSNRVGDVINLVIGLFLVPRVLDASQLGAVTPLMQVGTAVSLPLALLLLPVGKFLNVFATKGETGKCRALLQDTLFVSALFAIGMAIWLFACGDALLLRLGVENRRLLWPIAGFALLSCIQPVLDSASRSLKLFDTILWGNAITPYVRLAAMLLLLAPLGVLGYMLAQLSSALANALLLLAMIVWVLRRMGRRMPYLREHGREMFAYALPLALFTFASRIQGPMEPFVIRRWLPEEVSAGYYFVVTLGTIPTYFTLAMAPFLWTLVSERFEKGQSTQSLLLHSQAFALGVGGLFTLLFALFTPWFFSLPGPWRDYTGYAGFVWQVSLIRTLRTSLDYFMAYENACRRFRYLWYVVPTMLVESALLYGLPGWGAFRGVLPATLWARVDGWVANRLSLQFFLNIMIAAHVVFVAGLFLQLLHRRRHAV